MAGVAADAPLPAALRLDGDDADRIGGLLRERILDLAVVPAQKASSPLPADLMAQALAGDGAGTAQVLLRKDLAQAPGLHALLAALRLE
jgi:hypothetical protein